MNLWQPILLLAVASLSVASNCPFAKFAKAGHGGVPELDHEKLNDFVAKMKQYAPEGAAPLEEKLRAAFDPVSQQRDVRDDL
jgi:hypothetical protein